MKTILSLSALLITLTLTAQSNPATWYLNDTSGNGIQSPFGNTASGGFSTSLGQNTTASGEGSTAMGENTTASDYGSTAMGGETTASGVLSTAMGASTTASGGASTAMGENTTASGVLSTAMGLSTIASDTSSLVIGEYNLLGSTVTDSATEFSPDNTAFVIGNGADADNRSDALTVLFDGTTNVAGSVTATEFIGDGSQLTNLTSNSPFSYNTNNEGGIEIADYTTASGSRAFAVGNDNLASGSSSTAMGRGTIASGDDSTALGANTEASGRASTALGANTTASGDFSTTIGRNSIASGTNSFAIGYGASEEYDPELSSPYYKNEALGSDSFVIGRRNKSSGGKSFSVGNDNLTSGLGAGSIGENNIASGDYSYSIGLFNQSIGSKSIAIGNNSYADGYATTAIGSANTIDNNAQNEWSLNNRAFVIGNGVYDESTQQINRSDALTVLFDGTTNVAGSVTATSFIGDGSQLTNLSVSSPFSFNDTSGDGIQSSLANASGNHSFAMGDNATSSGFNSRALGIDTTASGNYSTAMGYQTEASGDFSTALGGKTIASGNNSTALGYHSDAIGELSTAIGWQPRASGMGSIAIGNFIEATGKFSTAMGYQTIASDYASTLIGQYNLMGSTSTNSATEFSTDNTAFVIGNGIDEGNRSDALTVLFDGTTNVAGSVTATEFIGDGSQLTNINYDNITFPIWRKGDAGGVEFGSSEASGYMAVAMGYDGVFASGWNSTAMGHSSGASGDRSTAMGAHTRASGNTSTAMGQQTTAIGDVSISMGDYTTASDYNSLVVGRYNLLGSTVTNSATEFSLENTAFVIGNGSGWDSSAQQTNRSDALTVLFDGTTTIAGDLSINSDARLKANIISLGSTLAKLLQIDGKTYTMKKDENKKQKIGVLAQDIEKVFPELVSESNGVKSVNYQGLVPVLINALKEQDSKMNEQEARIERLEKLLLDS